MRTFGRNIVNHVAIAALLGGLASLPARADGPGEIPALLSTGNGWELGIGVHHNEYKEHTETDPDFMHASGTLYDLHLDGHMTLDNGLYIRAIVRLGDASMDYSGSGTKENDNDRVNDVRFLLGKDFLVGASAVISPYVGLGARNLFDDARGLTSTGAAGYRRESQYVYLPIGASVRFRAGEAARVNATLEYNHLLRGWQKSYLSDACDSLYDINNRQPKGYGWRGAILFEKGDWSVGPVFEQWRINESQILYAGVDCTGTPIVGQEPANKTSEYGVRAAYRF